MTTELWVLLVVLTLPVIAAFVALKLSIDWVVKDWKLSNCKHSCMTSARMGRAFGNLNPRSEYAYYDGCIKRCDERLA